MLPDFPELKSKIEKLLLRRAIKLKDLHLGVFSEIPHIRIFEGDQMTTIQDGNRVPTEFRETSQEIAVHSGMTVRKMMDEWDKSTIEFAKKQEAYTTESLLKVIEEVGNTVEAGKEGLTPEKWFELLKKISFDFDKNGEPILPTIIVGNDVVMEKIKNCIESIFVQPELLKQYNLIIEIKREEWNDREASRKLVN